MTIWTFEQVVNWFSLIKLIKNCRMGDKVAARLAATSAGLPIIPGTDTAISTAEVKAVSHWVVI